MKSKGEELLAVQLTQAGIAFEREARVFSGRRFRFDFVVGSPAATRYGVDVHGFGGPMRHGGFAHMESDCEKTALASCVGFRHFAVTSSQVESGAALAFIRTALGRQPIEAWPTPPVARPKGTAERIRVKGRTKLARGPSDPGRPRAKAGKLPARVLRAAGLA